MDAALRIAEEIGGGFAPAIGTLVDLWCFRPPGAQPPSSDEQLAVVRRRSCWRRLASRPAERLLHQPSGVRVAPSGIAKGYAADALADLAAADRGRRHCLIEIGRRARSAMLADALGAVALVDYRREFAGRTNVRIILDTLRGFDGQCSAAILGDSGHREIPGWRA